MKKNIIGALLLSLSLATGLAICSTNTYAEEEDDNSAAANATSISLEPSSKTFQINSASSYDASFNFTNNGENEVKIEVYAAPYSYVYSSEEDLYKLGFTNENNYTQISRWITIKDANGNYVESPIFTVPAKETIEIAYRISTPDNIPAGGQYAVIFARTIGSQASSTGIRTEASAGMIIYGHSLEGETIRTAEIRDLTIYRGNKEQNSSDNFFASAKVKNTGNVDFNATGKMKVEPIIGAGTYETQGGIVSVIPESERVLSDEWKDAPSLGIYKVTWTVTAGDQTESIEKIVWLFPVWLIILIITLLTILIIWTIIGVRKRKERRSRLAV